MFSTFFLQSGQMPGIYDGMRRRKFALNKVNFIHNEATIVNRIFRILIGYLEMSKNSNWLKR